MNAIVKLNNGNIIFVTTLRKNDIVGHGLNLDSSKLNPKNFRVSNVPENSKVAFHEFKERMDKLNELLNNNNKSSELQKRLKKIDEWLLSNDINTEFRPYS